MEHQGNENSVTPINVMQEDEDKEATISYSEAFYKIWFLSRWVIVGTLLHPIYNIVNAIVLGHSGSEKMLAGLGLG